MLCVGDASVDLAAREVRRNGAPVHLEPQAFDVLEFLLRHRERVVSKSEILDAVWGDQFVSESALTTRIKQVRRAFGDDGQRQAVVRNIRGRGYRFVADVTVDDASRRDAEPVQRSPRTARLPRPLPLVGRDDELEWLQGAVASERLVTLFGPGGVGKTALAVHLAHREANRRQGGAAFVDLSGVDDAAAVPSAFRHAVGLAAPARSDHESIAALSAMDATIVVDNCEHLLEPVSSFLEELLATGGPVRIVATSRERLGVRGERVRSIDPLSSEAARELFLMLADRWHGRELDDLEIVDRIVSTIDGLPLAIEMAAARLSALSLAELAELLDETTGTLRSPDRAGSDRHRTLTDLVAWSESMLEPGDRLLFADLSVFSGPATLPDLVAVAAADGVTHASVIDRLGRLVDRSLVVADVERAPATYRLLATTRAHALTLERRPGIRGRHARWYAEVADAADRDLRSGDAEAQGNERFRTIADELRTAFAWAREHDRLTAGRIVESTLAYSQSRLRSEPFRWATALLRQPDLDSASRLAASASRAFAAVNGSELATAERLARSVLDADPPHRARVAALEALQDVHMFAGDLEAAAEVSRQLIDHGERHDDASARVYGVVGVILATLYADRREAASALMADVDDDDDLSPSGAAWLAYTRAECLVGEDPDAALAEYRRCMALASSVDARYVLAVARASLAAAVVRHGEPAVAFRQLRAILSDVQRDGNRSHSLAAMRSLVELLVRTGDHEPAMRLLGALSADDPMVAYGSQARRLEATRAIVEQRVGVGATSAWLDDGRRRGPDWAASHAIAVLDRP